MQRRSRAVARAHSVRVSAPAERPASASSRNGPFDQLIVFRGSGYCPHPRAPGALALSLDRERDLERKRGNQKLTDDLLDLILFQHLRSAMSAAVATAAVTTAEASDVSAAAKAARMATAKRLVMPSAIVMVLPIMVVPEIR